MIRFLKFVAFFAVAATGLWLGSSTSQAAFNANILIDDHVFDNSSSMGVGAIDNFLNGFPSSCISPNSGFEAKLPTGYSPSGGFTFGDFVSAGQVIAQSAQVYGINPQVLLTTLQKEQSIVMGAANFCNNGDENKYAAAMGYGCPDSGSVYNWSGVSLYRRSGVEHTSTGSTCVNTAAKAGFSQQVIRAAWLLKFGEQRSEGNTGWAVVNGNWNNSDDPGTCYGGPMTQGNRKRCSTDSQATFYDGYITIDGTSVHTDTGSTAALYWYTPHLHGNQNFVSIFEGWFGSTRGGYCITSLSAVQTDVAFHKYNSAVDSPDFLIESGSGSGCIESHVFAPGFTSWQAHIASNSASVNTADSQVLFGDLDGSGRDYPLLFGLRNTGSGQIESHVWRRDMQEWLAHAASNQPVVNPADCKILLADLGGTGKDQVVLVCLKNTSSGKIELHQWNPGMRTWAWHSITNMPAIDPAQATVVAGDVDGNGQDELILVAYNHTGSSKVEFHIWNPGQWSWRDHIVSNMPEIDAASANVQFADINGDGVDEAILVGFKSTGSGKIEFHIWNPGYYSWQAHIASNQPSQ